MRDRKLLKRIGVGLMLLFVLALVPSTFAAEGRTDDKVVIAADETVDDDLYVAGESIEINGTVNGDVIFGATSIVINGTVNGDLMGGAQEIIINGTVADDVRTGGYAVTVNGAVGGDLVAGGYGIHVAEGGSVGNDVLAGGLNIAVDGAVGGDVRFGALGVRINGSVAGDVRGEVGSAEDAPPFDPVMFDPTAPDYVRTDPGLTIGPNASIGGNLAYESSAESNVSSGAIAGDISFKQIVLEEAPVPVGRQILDRVWQAVQQWLVLLVIGFLVLRFAPAFIQRASEMINAQPLPTLGWGVLWLFAWPIVLGISFILIVMVASLLGQLTLGAVAGAIVGVGMLLIGVEIGLYILVLAFVAKLFVAHLLGKRLMSSAQPMVAFAVGALIVVVLGAIPYVGWLANLLIAAAGLGAIWFMLRNRPEKAPAPITA